MSESTFDGFPGLSRATAIPNVFFSTVLPRLKSPGDLLAFLWVARVTQQRRGEARFTTADEIWSEPSACASFESLGGGREGLERGIAACLDLGALLGLRLVAEGREQRLLFVNHPGSRRVVARARAGDLQLVPEAIVLAPEPEARPGIFRLYEETIGTITPLVGERLMEAADRFPLEWIEQAFREAAELNARNWRYVERILIRWAEEGRAHEAAERDPLEDQKQRFLGGNLGHVVRYR